MTIMKWRISGQGYTHLPGFQDSHCSNLQIVPCKRLTLSTASIFNNKREIFARRAMVDQARGPLLPERNLTFWST